MKPFSFWKKWLRPLRDGATASVAEAEDASGLVTGDPRADEHALQVLLESIAEVTSTMDLDHVLEDIVDKSLEVTQAERAIVFLGTSADDIRIGLARDRDGTDLGAGLQYSKSAVRKCLEVGHATKGIVQSDQEALELGKSVFDLKLRAVMCAPLQARDRFVGAIYVDSRVVRRDFTTRDLALFGALSSQLAIAIVNAQLHADSLQKVRLEKDVEIARRIQQHLLAPVPRDLHGVDVAVRYLAAEKASGDTYDIQRLADGRVALLIGDVTGHGIGAALLSHAAQAAVRSYLELLDDPGEVVRRLNNRLVAGVESGNFMSLLLLLVDARARTLHYVNAGHPPLLLCREGEVQTLGRTGMVLGVVEGSPYDVRGPVELCGGDTLLLRTDGVDEMMDAARTPFGEARLAATLASVCGGPAEDVATRIELALNEHAAGAPLQDDVTMVVARIHG